MRKGLTFLFLILASLLNAHQGFVENKGQWPKEVLFAVDIHEGRLFIQSNGYRVHQWDLSGMHHADLLTKLIQRISASRDMFSKSNGKAIGVFLSRWAASAYPLVQIFIWEMILFHGRAIAEVLKRSSSTMFIQALI